MAALGQVIHMNNTKCGCMEDYGDCVYAAFCNSCHLADIAQRTGSGDWLSTCIVAEIAKDSGFYTCYARGILQNALYRVGVNEQIGLCQVSLFKQCQVSREVNDRQAAAAVAGPAGSQPQVTAVQAPQVNYMQAGATVTGPAGSQPQVIVVQAPPAQVLCSI